MNRTFQCHKILSTEFVHTNIIFVIDVIRMSIEDEEYGNINYLGSKQQAECRSPSILFANTREGAIYTWRFLIESMYLVVYNT